MKSELKLIDGYLDELLDQPIPADVLEEFLIYPKQGFIKEYIETVTKTTDSPKIFHLFAAYALLSAVVGNRVYIPFGSNEIHCNVWAVVIAPSSLFRKTTALSIPRGYLWNQDYSKEKVLPSEFTPEALITTLEQNPEGILFCSEFGGFLSIMNKDYMQGTKELLTDLYDSPQLYIRKLKNSEYTIEQPALSIFGATTLNWFADRVKENDWHGGFLNRFLFVPATKKEKTLAWPEPPDPEGVKFIKNHLGKVNRFLDGKRLAIDDRHVKPVYIEWVNRFERQAGHSEELSGFLARLEVYVLKFAALNALTSDNPSVVPTKEHIEHAIRIVEWVYQSTTRLFSEEISFNPEEKMEKKILSLLEKEPQGLSQSALIKKVQGRNTYKWTKQIIQNLQEQGRIAPNKIPSGKQGGSPVTVFQLTS